MKIKEGVAVCVYRNNRFLFLKRAPHDKIPNLWEFPGGAIEKGENKLDAAKRELLEETGIIPNLLLYCGKIERRKKDLLTIIHFFITGLDEDVKIKLSKDHTAYKWYKKEECLKMKPSEEISIDAFRFLKSENLDHLIKVYKMLNFLITRCKKNIKKKFSIILIGSCARGEFIPMWSDLDLIFFVKTNGKPLPIQVLKNLKKNVESAQRIAKIPIWFKVHTEKTFFNNLSIDNLLSFYLEGNLLYGDDVLSELKKYIYKLKREEVEKSFKKLAIKNIYRIRYFYVGINKNNKEIGNIHIEREKYDHNYLLAGQIIDKTLEIAQFLLFARGKYIVNKREAAEKFIEEFKFFELNEIPYRFYKIRERWNKVSRKDIEFVLRKGPEFSEKLLALL